MLIRVICLQFSSLVVSCGNWNVIGLHKVIGRGTFRMCGFVGVDMALLEKVHHCEGGF